MVVPYCFHLFFSLHNTVTVRRITVSIAPFPGFVKLGNELTGRINAP
nr:MAG TPA: hypothetical protein [Caudoviricetes sp.]